MINNHKQKEKKIIFISSYPKSGNTWIRILISALLNNNRGIFNFNDLKKIRMFSNLEKYNKFNNIKFQKDGTLDIDFTINNWINAQKLINSQCNEFQLFKTHSFRGLINNKYFTDESVCAGFIYIIRDPRDIVISKAKYNGISIEESISELLYNEKYMVNPHKVIEIVNTWNNHLVSWHNFKTVPRLIIKYEDMIDDTLKILNQIIEYLNITTNFKMTTNKQQIENILKSTSFHQLQKLENEVGFNESSTYSKFFRKGKFKQWKKILSLNQIKLIEKELYKPMHTLGYL